MLPRRRTKTRKLLPFATWKKSKNGGSDENNVDIAKKVDEVQWRFLSPKQVNALIQRGSALMMSQVATFFESIIAAMNKRLQSRRKMEKKSSTIFDPIAVWPFTAANRFQLGFLHAAQDNLKSTLSMINVKFHVDLASKFITLQGSNGEDLRVSDLDGVLRDFDEICERFVDYDLAALVESMLEGCSQELGSRLQYLDSDESGTGVSHFIKSIKPKAVVVQEGKDTALRRQLVIRYGQEEPAPVEEGGGGAPLLGLSRTST